MNAQIIILLLLAIAVTAVVVNFHLYSDLRRMRSDLADCEAAAYFYEQETEYLTADLDFAVDTIRGMQEDLAYATSDVQAAYDQITSLEDMIAAIVHAHDITDDLWLIPADERPQPF